MKIAVYTPMTAFQNDIGDVVRLFYGEGAAVTAEEMADAQLVHAHEESEGQWCETFVLTSMDGQPGAEYTECARLFREAWRKSVSLNAL